MRDYTQRGLLSLLILAFRGTTGVSAVGSLCTIQIYRCVLPERTGIYRVRTEREKIAIRTRPTSITLSRVMRLVSKHVLFPVPFTAYWRRDVNESEAGNVNPV